MPLCVHCEERYASASRGLCHVCYRNSAIRECYPPHYATTHRTEPTMEELDRMIAEQLPTMPSYDPVEDNLDRRREKQNRARAASQRRRRAKS